MDMSDVQPTRVARLREALRESQQAFGARFGVSQDTVSRLELRIQDETPPQKLLLDRIETDIAEGRIGAADQTEASADAA